ncbi:hypothetical protein [Microcystis sp. BLCC-F210]
MVSPGVLFLGQFLQKYSQCAWCVPQKSIAGAVGVTLEKAPYS